MTRRRAYSMDDPPASAFRHVNLFTQKKLERKVAVLTRKVKNVTENKYYDKEVVPAEVYTTGTFTVLSGVARGDGPSDRDGDSARFKHIDLRARIIPDVDDAYNLLRIIIFKYKGQQGQTPTLSDILENNTYPVTSHFNFDNRNLFKILYDRVVPVNLEANGPQFINWKKKINVKTMYSASTGGAASTVDGGLWALMISTEGTATEAPQVGFTTRLTFDE